MEATPVPPKPPVVAPPPSKDIVPVETKKETKATEPDLEKRNTLDGEDKVKVEVEPKTGPLELGEDCPVCKNTGAVPKTITIDQQTGDQVVTEWRNCINCTLTKNGDNNYVRVLAKKPDPEEVLEQIEEKERVLEARENEKFERDRLKRAEGAL